MFSNYRVGWVERNQTQQMNEECWVTLREAPSGLRSSNATSYNGGNLPSGSTLCLCRGTRPPQVFHRNRVAPQPTIYANFGFENTP